MSPLCDFRKTTITSGPSTLYTMRNRTLVSVVSVTSKKTRLMWTHYADNYAGICIGYRPDELVKGLPPEFHLVRLAYGSHPPPLDGADVHNPRAAAMRILSHKKSSWNYEREWRLLGTVGEVKIAAKATVRELYLGSLISEEHKEKILSE